MKVVILGAGVVGTASAWFLNQAGCAVTVFDRQPAAGMETSFANGGQISVSHAEPWANPHAIGQLLRWIGKKDAPLLFHLRFDPQLWRWGLQFLRQCTPARTRANIAAIVQLALYSRGTLQALRQQLGPDFGRAYDCLEKGILHLYTDPDEFARAAGAARLMRELGLDRTPVDAERCVEIEPALAAARPLLVGGDYTASDESGDAHRFTQALAAHAAAAGVTFAYRTPLAGLEIAAGRVRGVRLADGRLENADAVVVALGSYSAPFLRPYGLYVPVYPAKGYSATLDLLPGTPAPTVSLTDDGRKLVFSRLGNRLRIAGTAEFNGYNLDLDPLRCQALVARTRMLFPELEYRGEPAFWCGLRPATPANVPLIGAAPLPGLWLNTGHGTLGWTLACGSGAALADLICGRAPTPDFPFLRRT